MLGTFLLLSPRASVKAPRWRKPLQVFSQSSLLGIVGYIVLAFPLASGLQAYYQQLTGGHWFTLDILVSVLAVPFLILLAITKGEAESRLEDLMDTG